VRRRALLLFLLFCLACGRKETPVAATASAPLPDPSEPQDGGTLIRRLPADVTTLNPIVMATRYDRYVVNYLFTPLVGLDRNLQAIPALADSWEISEDGLTYRFELNEKATYSNGQPVRASDVVYTLAKIADPNTGAVQAHDAFAHLDLAGTRAIDDHTVEVKFSERKAGQLVRFNDVLVVPEQVYSLGDFRKDFVMRAVGSGPYEVVRRVVGNEIVLQRRKTYWRERPHIETVVLKVINDHVTAFQALKSGELDESIIASDTWLREHNNPQSTRTLNFQRFYGLNYNFIAWNGRNPKLADKRVRRAMAMCIPVEAVIQNLFQGTGRALSGPFLPDDWAYNPTVPVVRYDPQAALELLEQAGWKDTNSDGVLDQNGKPFRIEMLLMSGSATTQQFGQMVQSELKKIGVQVDLRLMDGTAAIERMFAGDYDAGYLSWDLDIDNDPFGIFHSSQFAPKGHNFVFYSNPEADRLLEEGRRELDQAKRKEIYWQLHALLAEDQPYTWVVQVSQKFALNRREIGRASCRERV